jgi:creatinine amidohydrolase
VLIEEITMGDFEEGLQVTKSVLIPFGSIEEHGYHLPLSTDTIQAYEVAKAVSKLIPLFVAPPVHYGCCRSTSSHPGTISISTNTLKNILSDLVQSFYKHGIRNFIILSGHAGGTHRMALQDAGEELILKFTDIKLAILSEYDLAYKAGRNLIDTENDSHAGEIETSRIMYLYPHLVKGTGLREYPSFPHGILVRNKRKYWLNGVWGDPTKSSEEKGRVLNELVVRKLLEFIKMMEDFDE